MADAEAFVAFERDPMATEYDPWERAWYPMALEYSPSACVWAPMAVAYEPVTVVM